ncbi:hypothetical protein JXL21_13425 [Candidatus Bathyarchaeota archaeon]|nr:hypothetical protein [Candidatus Bathyarchaeota archaeon]
MGNMVVVGSTYSTDFPVLNAYQQGYAGGFSDNIHIVGGEGFITKLSQEGELMWSTFLGGSGLDGCLGVEVFGGETVVMGVTNSTDFPVVGGVGQQTYRGGGADGFVAVLDSDGELLRSCYFGGSETDAPDDMVIDDDGRLVLTGYTSSSDLPVTEDAHQRSRNGETDGFLAVMDPESFDIIYLTYFGGSGRDGASEVSTRLDNDIYISGWTQSTDFPVTGDAFQGTITGSERDIFLVRFSEAGQLEYASYLGGSEMEDCFGLDVDSEGCAILSGRTWSSDYPTANAIQPEYSGIEVDSLVTKFSPEGAELVFSTFLGYAGWDTLHRVCVDEEDNIILAGIADSDDFPVVNAFQETKNAGADIYMIMLDPDGSPLFSSYLGGSSGELPWSILYEDGVLYLTAHVSSGDILVSEDAYQSTKASDEDGYLFRFELDRYLEDQPAAEWRPPDEPEEEGNGGLSYWTSYVVVVGALALLGTAWLVYTRRQG